MKTKEPKFMKELREVRNKMAKEWGKMSSKEMLESIRRQAIAGFPSEHKVLKKSNGVGLGIS